MPRFNVQHPVTGEWRCFSTIVDDWITDWMDEKRYQAWREYEYGRSAGDVRSANQMSIDEAESITLKGMLIVNAKKEQPAVDMAVKAVKDMRDIGEWDEDGDCPFCGYTQQYADDQYCGGCGAYLGGNHDR